MILDERICRTERLLAAAKQMMTAGRTAPKGKGVDLIEILALTGDDITSLANAMRAACAENGMKFFLRDADNLGQAEAVLLVGCRTQVMSLNCGYCGYADCGEKSKHPQTPCAVNVVDLGIAIGSMVATAADLRVDCRVMFSAGVGAKRMGLLTDCHSVYAIPISGSSKNPFFDRPTSK